MQKTLVKFAYQLRNWKAHARWMFIGAYHAVDGQLAKWLNDTSKVKIYANLNATLIDKHGDRTPLGIVSRRVVTTAFVNYLRDCMANGAGGADIKTFKYHDCGTGTTNEAITDTALVTPCTTQLNPNTTRAVGTQDNATAKTYKSVGTLVFDEVVTVTEHGVFNAASAGVLADRSKFAGIPRDPGESIDFVWSLVIADGG